MADTPEPKMFHCIIPVPAQMLQDQKVIDSVANQRRDDFLYENNAILVEGSFHVVESKFMTTDKDGRPIEQAARDEFTQAIWYHYQGMAYRPEPESNA